MPNSQTMRRAISVARSMSLPAPLVICRRNSSSAIAAAHQNRDLRFEELARVRVAIAFGQLHRDAQRPAARDDRDLVQRIGVRQQRRDDRVARFVIRAGDALVLGHRQRLALDAHQHLVARLVEIAVGDRLAAAAGRRRAPPR